MGLSMDQMAFVLIIKDPKTGLDENRGVTMELEFVSRFLADEGNHVRKVEAWELRESNDNPNPITTMYSLEDLENL